jgi:DNA invertase Pin-like site-specific DNA recombinase
VQGRQIEGYAHMHGLTLRGVIVEEGVSGSVPVHERPKGGPLFAGLRKGDVVIAPKLDRLFRSALDALQVVEDLRKRGVSLHLLDLGGDTSGNGLSKLFLTIAAAFAEAERDRTASGLGRSRLIKRPVAATSAASSRSAIDAASTASSFPHEPSRRPSARWLL